MKNGLALACVFLLGAPLAVGCGGVAPEGTEDTETPVSLERDDLPSGTDQTEPASEEEQVRDFAVCCYVACRDGGGDRWRGPYPQVKYNNCSAYGRYYCGQHKWPFKGAKWDGC